MPVLIRFHVRILSAAVLAVLLIPTTATAQDNQRAHCSTPEYRQFDFWVGDWVVHDAAGKLAGTNTITPMLNGCVLHEQWAGAGGSVGESFNIYDQRTGMWHQTWVDAGGLLLVLDGGIEDEHGRYEVGSWVRYPVGSRHAVYSEIICAVNMISVSNNPKLRKLL